MKKFITLTVDDIVAITPSIVNEADDVTIQLIWVTQTQYAVYYVA